MGGEGGGGVQGGGGLVLTPHAYLLPRLLLLEALQPSALYHCLCASDPSLFCRTAVQPSPFFWSLGNRFWEGSRKNQMGRLVENNRVGRVVGNNRWAEETSWELRGGGRGLVKRGQSRNVL